MISVLLPKQKGQLGLTGSSEGASLLRASGLKDDLLSVSLAAPSLQVMSLSFTRPTVPGCDHLLHVRQHLHLGNQVHAPDPRPNHYPAAPGQY